MPLTLAFKIATAADAPAIAALRNAASEELTTRFGKGHWTYQVTEKSILGAMKGRSQVFIAKKRRKVVGTLNLLSKKPWAIDANYFTPVSKPLYLISMAVHPDYQHMGIGRFMLTEILPYARSWPADVIRLDAYDAEAGAGPFYQKCGYVPRGRNVYRHNPLLYFEKLL